MAASMADLMVDLRVASMADSKAVLRQVLRQGLRQVLQQVQSEVHQVYTESTTGSLNIRIPPRKGWVPSSPGHRIVAKHRHEGQEL